MIPFESMHAAIISMTSVEAVGSDPNGYCSALRRLCTYVKDARVRSLDPDLRSIIWFEFQEGLDRILGGEQARIVRFKKLPMYLEANRSFEPQTATPTADSRHRRMRAEGAWTGRSTGEPRRLRAV